MQRFAIALLLLGLAIGQPEEARAAAVNVSPVKINLSSKSSSALVTMTNTEDRPVRFQVDVLAWEEDERGEMKLKPTKDLVFFPAFLVLEPKKSGKIRVGSEAKVGKTEKSYRLIVEELPPPETETTPGTVAVLTRMSIPVFVDPSEPKREGDLGASLKSGKVAVELSNTGNVHLVPQGVQVKGLDAKGEVVFAKDFQGWYVLAGKRRLYEAEIPQKDCPKVAAVVVEAKVQEKQISKRVEVGTPSCGP